MALQEFGKRIKRGFTIPHDPFAHQQLLLLPDDSEEFHFTKEEFKNIINKRILLSNIADSETLSIYQQQANYLISLFAMALEDEGLRGLFSILYSRFSSELALTRVMNGKEREQQSSTAGWSPSGEFPAYELAEEDEKNNPITNIISGFFKKKRKNPFTQR